MHELYVYDKRNKFIMKEMTYVYLMAITIMICSLLFTIKQDFNLAVINALMGYLFIFKKDKK